MGIPAAGSGFAARVGGGREPIMQSAAIVQVWTSARTTTLCVLSRPVTMARLPSCTTGTPGGCSCVCSVVAQTPVLAEEVLQDTFVSVWSSAARYRTGSVGG